ncbi:MAG: MotA/TolQ/ExbB proton channel family protein [Planctomycetaceae bacterium]|nr:MotA/TolQ/ExbB proton channel family protein [Planctomycetaceae bacterium]MCB9952296.1 MotA/TolQ/ExbB proton channel family protein [Planctomycetaceae bacterium]
MIMECSAIFRKLALSLFVLAVVFAVIPPALAQQPTPADSTPSVSEPGLGSLSGDETPTPPPPVGGETLAQRLLNSLPENLLQIVQSLNYWLIPFGIATFLALWFTTERLVVLRRGRVIPGPFVQRFIKLIEDGELDRDEAMQICEENGSPVASVFAHGVRKWGKSSVEVEQAIIDGGERQVGALRKNLRVINGIATITPLIGLLGTVWGMLESFNHIAEAGASGNTGTLAAGIALALVTTAAGLMIAIPSLIAYMYLSGRVDALVMEMDDLAQRVVHSISAEGLEERATRPRTVPKPEAPQKKAV